MKNKEKYLDEISEAFASIDGTYGICKVRKRHVIKPEECISIACNECEKRTREWLEEEYQEPITLSEDEKAILRNIDKRYKWIARHYGTLEIYEDKPYKANKTWIFKSGIGDVLRPFNHLFTFIKAEDTEPYSIEDLLNESGE